MKINLDEIPEDGLSLDLCAGGAELSALAGGFDFSIVSEVTAHLDVNGDNGRVFVNGALKTGLSFKCSRCLKDFPKVLDTAFTIFYVRGKVEDRESELTSNDLEVNYLEGAELDTDELLVGQLALEAPVQPLCSEGCKGLCQRCGKDLNVGPCGCKAEDAKIDPRLAGLKGLKLK